MAGGLGQSRARPVADRQEQRTRAEAVQRFTDRQPFEQTAGGQQQMPVPAADDERDLGEGVPLQQRRDAGEIGVVEERRGDVHTAGAARHDRDRLPIRPPVQPPIQPRRRAVRYRNGPVRWLQPVAVGEPDQRGSIAGFAQADQPPAAERAVGQHPCAGVHQVGEQQIGQGGHHGVLDQQPVAGGPTDQHERVAVQCGQQRHGQ